MNAAGRAFGEWWAREYGADYPTGTEFDKEDMGLAYVSPKRRRQDVGICRACFEQGLFDALLAESADCPDCGHAQKIHQEGLGCLNDGCQCEQSFDEPAES